MPIYKVYRNGVQERKNRRMLSKMRWVALLVSALLLCTAAAMFIHAWR